MDDFLARGDSKFAIKPELPARFCY